MNPGFHRDGDSEFCFSAPSPGIAFTCKNYFFQFYPVCARNLEFEMSLGASNSHTFAILSTGDLDTTVALQPLMAYQRNELSW